MHMPAPASMLTALLVAMLSALGCAALQKGDDKVERNHLTDSGTGALACTLAAADSAERPTLERLHLNRHPGIGCATAAALAAAPLQSLSKLSMSHGGALHLHAANGSLA
jgi:hypothetical protein